MDSSLFRNVGSGCGFQTAAY